MSKKKLNFINITEYDYFWIAIYSYFCDRISML